MTAKISISLALVWITMFTVFNSCEEEKTVSTGQSGMIKLSLTDAPIDDTSITGVYITITGIQYHKQNGNWASFEEFEGPQKFNLRLLQDSISALLGNFELETGQYNQLRFMLNAPEKGHGPPTTPGCYLEYAKGTTQPLFVPSGGQSGYKATGAFRVPSNGTVELTADFDVRKSIVKAGNSGMYILKPAIRLIVNGQAGSIGGAITGMSTDSCQIVVYAYEDDTYSDEEAAEPAAEENRFPSAISSDMVCDSNQYHLHYLAPKTYDLVITKILENDEVQILGFVEDVEVISRKKTTQPINLTDVSS